MAKLTNRTTETTLIDPLKVARSFKSRALGLIGTQSLNPEEGVWFPKSNWIHTWFMSIPIDVIYLDSQMRVTKIQPHLKPWTFPAPVFKASSVLETGVGFIEKYQVKVGDEFHVGD